MSHKYRTRTNIKKIEDSFSDKYSDSDQDDTKIQPNEDERTFKKSTKAQTKVQPNSVRINKKEEYYTKRIEPDSNVKRLKKQEDQDRYDQKQESKILKNQSNKSSIHKNEKSQEKQYKKSQQSKGKRIKRARSENQNDEMENRANEIMDSLDQAYEDDVELYKNKKPADKKLKLMPYVTKSLKQLELAWNFIKMDGLMLFVRWLYPNEQTNQDTSLTVKIQLLNLLLDLSVTKQNIENSEELEIVIKKYRKSKFKVLREISENIVKKWKIIKAISTN